MFRIAIRSLVHDRGKLLAALAGVSFAATLLLTQVGLYVGFLEMSAAMIIRHGGDLWVMARGTEVIDNGEVLSAGSRNIVAAHPCVSRVRGLVMGFAPIRKPGGVLDTVVIVGFEPDPAARPMIPWSFARGLPQDLHGPNRIAVDTLDVTKLQLRGDPLGATLEINGHTAFIAAITSGIRSFTLLPFVFAEADTARALVGMERGQANYWIVDLRDRSCMADVVRSIERHPDLQALPRAEFERRTEDYWVTGSGAGTALAFSAVLGLIVGIVIVAQTLYSITKEHLRELGTLKAIGATRVELSGFVGWQAAFLALFGGSLGFGFAWIAKVVTERLGLTVSFSPGVLALGAAAIVGMCLVAAIGSVRRVMKLEAVEVFK